MPRRPHGPADRGGARRGSGKGDERGSAEADQQSGVLELTDDRIALVHIVLLPDRAQTAAHRTDPADAGEEQQCTGDQPDRARIGHQIADAELVGDARHLVGDRLLDLVQLLVGEQRGADRRADSDQREERQEADEGDRGGEPGPVDQVQPFVRAPGVRHHQPGDEWPDDGKILQPVHDVRVPSWARKTGVRARARGRRVVPGRARGRHGRTDQLHHRAAGVDGDQHPVRPRRNPAGGPLTGRRPPVRTGPSAPAR